MDSDVHESEAMHHKFSYLIALFVSLISTTAPIMFMLSCTIVIKFQQGDYEQANWKSYNVIQKAFYYLLLTILGYLVMTIVYLIEVIKKQLLLLGIIFGERGFKSINIFFEKIQINIARLNSYQLKQLAESSKACQMLFEDLPQIILLFCIGSGFLRCNGLTGDDLDTEVIWGLTKLQVLQFTFIMTILNILKTWLTIKFTAKSLNESRVLYLMTRITANNKWFPFSHEFSAQKMEHNISLSHIKVELPFFTNVLGVIQTIEFEFSDSTLYTFLNKLITWASQSHQVLNGTHKKRELIINEKCVQRVTLNMLVHFISNFPRQLFDLRLNVDMETLFQRKKNDHCIIYKSVGDGQHRSILTVTGHSVLVVCMRNEKQDGWILRPVFEQILQDKEILFDKDDLGYEHPLSQAITYGCLESIQFMTSQPEYESNGLLPFKFDETNPHTGSFFGVLIDKIKSIGQQGPNYKEFVELLDTVSDNIDFNEPLIMNFKKMVPITTIQYMAKELRSDGECDKIPDSVAIMSKITSKNLGAKSQIEKRTVFNNTVKFLAMFSPSYSNHRRCLDALSTICNQSQIDLLAGSIMTRLKAETIVYKNRISEKRTKDHRFMCDILIEDWHTESIQDFESQMKYFYYREPGKVSEKSPLHIVLEQAEVRKVKQHLFDRNTISSILYILQQEKLSIGPTLAESAIKFVEDNRNNPDMPEILKLIKKSCTSEADGVYEAKYSKKVIDFLSKPLVPSKTTNLLESPMLQPSAQDVDAENLANIVKQKEKSNFMRYTSAKLQNPVRLQNLPQKPDKIYQKMLGRTVKGIFLHVIEYIALADFITDIYILIQLIQSIHIAWASVTIFSMLASFYICHIPYMSFLIDKINKIENGKQTWKQYVLCLIMVLPLMVIFLQFMDIFFLLNTVFFQPIVKGYSYYTGRDTSKIEDYLENLYQVLFEMQSLDVAGFRRMRTISQLTFESTTQIILQTRIYLFLKYDEWRPEGFELQGDESKFQVTVGSIYISLIIAISHAVLEWIFLALEAKVSKTSLLNYMIVCFNGRYGWVPYQEYLTIQSQSLKDKAQKKKSDDKDNKESERIKLNFADVSSTIIFNINLSVDFKFTDDTISSLSHVLGTFPQQDKEQNMPKITFEDTIDNCSLDNLVTLMILSANRVSISLWRVDLEKIFQQSKYSKLLDVKNPNDLDQAHHQFLDALFKKRVYLLIDFLLQRNENLMTLRINYGDDKINLGELALETKDAKLLECLLKQNNPIFDGYLGEVDANRKTLTLKLLMTEKFQIWEQFAKYTDILEDAVTLKLLSIYNTMVVEYKERFDYSRRFWHIRFGNGCPQEWISLMGASWMNTQYDKYPNKLYFSIGDEFCEFETKAVFKFACLRRILAQKWKIDYNGPQIDEVFTQGFSKEKPIDLTIHFGPDKRLQLENLKILTMIMSEEDHQQVHNLTASEVDCLDNLASFLKLDTCKWLYYSRTRLNDQSGHSIDCTLYGENVQQKIEKKHDIFAYYPNEFANDYFVDFNSFGNSLSFQFSENVAGVLKQKYEYQPRASQQSSIIQLGFFSKYKSHSFYLDVLEHENFTPALLEFDSLEMSQIDVKRRIGMIDANQVTTMTAISAFKPDSHITFTTRSNQIPKIKGLKVQFRIAYKVGTDMEKEVQNLKKQCKQFYQNWKRQDDEMQRVIKEAQVRRQSKMIYQNYQINPMINSQKPPKQNVGFQPVSQLLIAEHNKSQNIENESLKLTNVINEQSQSKSQGDDLEQTWTCPECEQVNQPDSQNCEMCEEPRPKSKYNNQTSQINSQTQQHQTSNSISFQKAQAPPNPVPMQKPQPQMAQSSQQQKKATWLYNAGTDESQNWVLYNHDTARQIEEQYKQVTLGNALQNYTVTFGGITHQIDFSMNSYIPNGDSSKEQDIIRQEPGI